MIKMVEVRNEWVHVKLEGDLYVKDASLLREKLIPYAESGKGHFHFDFTDVTFIDSAGLGVLVAIYKRAAEQNGIVRIYNPIPSVKEIFELTRLHHIFEIAGR